MALLKYIGLKIRAKSSKVTLKFLTIVYINELPGVIFKRLNRRVYFLRFLLLTRDAASRIRDCFRDMNSGLYRGETLPLSPLPSLLHPRRLYLERAGINTLFSDDFRSLYPKNARWPLFLDMSFQFPPVLLDTTALSWTSRWYKAFLKSWAGWRSQQREETKQRKRVL